MCWESIYAGEIVITRARQLYVGAHSKRDSFNKRRVKRLSDGKGIDLHSRGSGFQTKLVYRHTRKHRLGHDWKRRGNVKHKALLSGNKRPKYTLSKVRDV